MGGKELALVLLGQRGLGSGHGILADAQLDIVDQTRTAGHYIRNETATYSSE